MTDEYDLFQREKPRFESAVDFAISVSKLAAGRNVSKPVVMASYVFTRLCVGSDSLRYLLNRETSQSKEQTLDHYSISVLARNIVEGSLMFHYLMEDGVCDEQWGLRSKVLNLHDVTLKLRLFKGIGDEKQYAAFKGEMTKLRQEIEQHPVFKELDKERQKRLLAGHEIYVGGQRSTLKLLGFENEYFDGMYAYMSAQVHVSPTSFYGTHQRLSFGPPADYQYYLASYALAHARIFLLRASIRLAESDIAIADKVDGATLQSMKELAEVPFGD